MKKSNDPNEKKKRFHTKRWVGCPVEAEYFGDERKQSKLERKIASAKDRSKYKKTDREKFQKTSDIHKNIKIDKEQLLRGRVLTIASQGIIVDYEGKTVTCTLRGLLKKEKSQAKNLVTVGDFVLFEKTSEEEGFIAHVEPRHSILSRADNLSHRKEQLIAANIDQVLVTVSVVSPSLKPSLVDRYIIATKKGGMEPIVIVNKIDLLDDPSVEKSLRENQKQLYLDFIKAYQGAGIPVIAVSAVTSMGLDALKDAMQGKASVFSGQSGVGKSSLINVLSGYQLRVGKVVDRTKKGSHTTTTTQLLSLDFGGWCIDTPGIRSFGIWDLKKEEVEKYFEEIHRCGRQCRFPNCSHSHEDGCAVLDAIEQGKISPIRYDSYISLIESISRQHLRR
jgi:ribosome biogenesis GTPase / thiamine phosphate phosphatase